MKVGDPTPNQHGFEKIMLLNGGDLPHRILYEYTPYQITNIGEMIKRGQQHIRTMIANVKRIDN